MSKNAYRRTGNNFAFLFSMLLFLVFILCSIFTILIGSQVYSNIQARNNTSFYSDTALSYITNKVRQSDTRDSILVTQEEGLNVLLLRSQLGGTACETRIYAQDGTLYELFSVAGADLPLNSGNPVMECDGVAFLLTEEEDSSLLTIQLARKDGSDEKAVLSLRSAKGDDTP